jgi:hypothetical protein
VLVRMGLVVYGCNGVYFALSMELLVVGYHARHFMLLLSPTLIISSTTVLRFNLSFNVTLLALSLIADLKPPIGDYTASLKPDLVSYTLEGDVSTPVISHYLLEFLRCFFLIIPSIDLVSQ